MIRQFGNGVGENLRDCHIVAEVVRFAMAGTTYGQDWCGLSASPSGKQLEFLCDYLEHLEQKHERLRDDNELLEE